MKKGILYERGELDVLPYYAKVVKCLKDFLKDKEIASKVHLSDLFFLNRGSNKKPLFICDFSSVNEKMLSLRKNHLKDVKNQLSEKQQLVWEYFPPRKLIQFFYACNGESAGKPIERIFIDIDRRKHSPEEARTVALELINSVKSDKEFNSLLKYRIVVLWTGKSFHVYLLLNKKIDLSFYNRYLSYGSGKNKEESFIMKWADEINQKTKISAVAGHEKSDKFIILDSSNTPSGKLARAPFSIHVKDWKTIDGVCVPISVDELGDKNLIKKIEKLTPDEVLRDLEKYEKLL
jgi:hypothetical protein